MNDQPIWAERITQRAILRTFDRVCASLLGDEHGSRTQVWQNRYPSRNRPGPVLPKTGKTSWNLIFENVEPETDFHP
jgi:hypothetical protein